MPQMIDETGKRYGRLVVLERTAKKVSGNGAWLCQCDCGNIKAVSGHHLRSCMVRSCGCMAAPDETGNVYGRLTVIKLHPQRRNNFLVWICRCECGTDDVLALGRQLRNGLKKSCGCLCGDSARALSKRRYPWGAGISRLMGQYLTSADNRGLSFGLSVEKFRELVTANCHYCGIKPSRETVGEFFNGIDRVDNTKGYLPGNCVPCCTDCNNSKLNLTEAAFISWIKRVHDHLFGKEAIANGK